MTTKISPVTAEVDIRVVKREKLDWNPFDPRIQRPPERVEAMVASILENGLIHRPVARKGTKRGRYQLGCGRTRSEAIMLLMERGQWPLPGIPVDVRDLTDKQMALMALAENDDRTQLTDIERIRGYKRALDEVSDLKIDELAESVGVARPTLSNLLRILTLPPVVLDVVAEGRMSPHAAREFLVLMHGKHLHKREMAWVIDSISQTSGSSGLPDFRVAHVREMIREVVGRFGTDWRPLEKAEGDASTYGSSYGEHAREPTFDTAAYEKAHPDKVHIIPRRRKGTRKWTCDAKEWRRWQTQATREANKKAAGKVKAGSKISGQDAQDFMSLLAHDPVAQAAVGVSQETLVGRVLEKHTPPVMPPEMAEPLEEGKLPPGEGYKKLNAYLANFVQRNPDPSKWEDALYESTDIIHAELELEKYGIDPEDISDAIMHFLDHIRKRMAAEAAQVVKKADHEKLREKLGTRASPLKDEGYKGWKQLIAGSNSEGPPQYFDVDQCVRLCTEGAVYLKRRYYGTCLACINKECFQERLRVSEEAFAKQVKETRDQQDQANAALAAIIMPLLSDPKLARLVAYLNSQHQYHAVTPAQSEKFSYIPACLERLARLLKLKRGECRSQYESYIKSDEVMPATLTMKGDVAPEVAAQLLVYSLRQETGYGRGDQKDWVAHFSNLFNRK